MSLCSRPVHSATDRSHFRRAARLVAALAATLLLSACSGAIPPLRPELRSAAEQRDALGLVEALDRLIDADTATDGDREAAYDAIQRWEEPTASYAYARAALAGRVAQIRGLSAIGLVGEVERYARQCLELDPKFRDGAASRMLGTMYVLAPASLVEHGDSETGLEMLEKLAQERPTELENQVRVAEAYVALGDPDPATPYLCTCKAGRAKLRPESQRLLAKLLSEVESDGPLSCPTLSSAPPPSPASSTPAPEPPVAPPPAPASAAPSATPAAAPAPAKP